MVAKNRMLSKLAGIALGSVLTLSALAEDGTLDTIVVTGRPTAEPLSKVAGSVGVVDEQTLDLVQHSHINESADRVAGVWISRGNGQEHLTAIRSPVVTGPGSCGAFLILEDGIPTRPTGFCNVNQLFELNTEQANRLEIFKGPDSAVYGNNAVHGVINVISPQITTQEQSSLTIDGGPHDYSRALVSYSDGKNLRLDFHGDHDSGFIDNAGFDQQKLSARYQGEQEGYRVESLVEVSNLNQETAGYLEQGDGAYKIDHLKNDNGNPEAFRDAQSIHGYSSYIFNSGAANEFRITPYANASDMTFLQHYIRGTPLEKNGHESVGVNGHFDYPLGFFADNKVSMVSGFTLETGRAYVDQYQEKPTVPASANYPQGQQYDFDVFMNTIALFSEFQYVINSQTTVIAGIRHDHQFYDYQNKLPASNFGVYTRPASRDDEFGNWGFNAGLLYDWFPRHQFFLNSSSGFRTPQVAELYRLEGGQPLNSVQSERINSTELGLRGAFVSASAEGSNRLSYEMAIFDMWKDHVIFKNALRQYMGSGVTSHRGIELTLDYHTAENYFAKTALSYAEHRYERVDEQLQGSPVVDLSNNIIDTAPRHFGSLQLGREFGWGLVELEVKHIGPYYLDPEHDWQYAGHNLVNLRSMWQVDKEWKLTARLLNVLNKDYAERADVAFNNTPRYFVGEPRSFYLSVEKTFN